MLPRGKAKRSQSTAPKAEDDPPGFAFGETTLPYAGRANKEDGKKGSQSTESLPLSPSSVGYADTQLLRYPKKSSDLRYSSIFSTAAP